MTFKKLMKGRAFVLPVTFEGAEDAEDVGDRVTAAVGALVLREAFNASELWDVAAALHHAHLPPDASDAADADEDEVVVAVSRPDPPVCTAEITQARLPSSRACIRQSSSLRPMNLTKAYS